jgi:negative regulator of sigma E activity
MSTRYSVTAARAVPRGEQEASAKEAIIKLLDTETLVNEAIEHLVKGPEELERRDAADTLLGDAMRRIAQARAVLHELRRAAVGQPTIASTG